MKNFIIFLLELLHVPYLFGYKTGVSPLQNDYKYLNQLYVIFAIIRVLPFLNSLKDLDPSYKTDLDLKNCLGRKKILSYIRGNTVTTSNCASDLILLGLVQD